MPCNFDTTAKESKKKHKCAEFRTAAAPLPAFGSDPLGEFGTCRFPPTSSSCQDAEVELTS